MDFMAIVLLIAGLCIGFGFGWVAASARLERTRRELTEARERAVIFRAEKEALEKAQGALKPQFENLANSILENITAKFGTQSEKKIGDLLNPLRERLGEFQKTISESFSAHGKEQYSLKKEIERVVLQADGLTKALRGDVKAQGNWGEVMLEKILEQSGLRKDSDYIIQGVDLRLTGAEGNRLKPDVIVNLPDKKHIIIDSKVSLTAYERYCLETDEEKRQAYLKDFLKSIKAHVAALEQKRYQDIDQLNPPDLVLMFMPIEGAFSLAVQHDPELHPYAWDKKIVIVCPSTLFATLRTVASLWRMDAQSKNVEDMARKAGSLYDKFVGFVEDLKSIGTHMHRMNASYDQAMNKLSEGRGNLVASVEKLKTLGAGTTKSMPIEVKHLEDAEEPEAIAS